MKIDEPELCEQDNRIAINDRWVDDLLRLYPGAISVSLQHHKDPSVKGKGFEKIQGVRMTQRTQPNARPREDFDEVVDVIAKSAWAWLALQVEEGVFTPEDAVGFSIQVQRMSSGSTSRPRVYFTASLDGNADDPYDDPAIQAVSELERRQNHLLETQQAIINNQREHISEMQDRYLQIATINSQPMAQIAKMMEMSGSMMGSGMTALLSGYKMQFDERKVELEQREQSKRTQAIIESVRENVQPLLPLAMQIIASKINVGNMPQPPESAPDETDGPTVEDIDTFYRTALQDFRDSITDDQHTAVKQALAQSEQDAFYAILDANTAMDVFERMHAFIQGADLSVLGELQQILEPPQMATVMQIYGAYAQWYEATHD